MADISTKVIPAVALIAGATAFDVYFKIIALAGAQLGTGPLRFELFRNPGIAFSIPLPLFIVTPLTVVLLVIIAYLFSIESGRIQRLLLLCAGVGALSNLVDRLINGFTTDYLIIYNLAINLADLLIIFGIAGIAWYTQKVQA